jgi:hypothetical protein
MTDSWPAFQHFQRGLEAMRRFGEDARDAASDYDALNQTIDEFRRSDPMNCVHHKA